MNAISWNGLGVGGCGRGSVTVKITAVGLVSVSFCRNEDVLSNAISACCGR